MASKRKHSRPIPLLFEKNTNTHFTFTQKIKMNDPQVFLENILGTDKTDDVHPVKSVMKLKQK